MHASVVAKMNDLSAFALHNSSHNINSRIMSVKQRSSSYDSYFMIFFIRHIYLDGLLYELNSSIFTPGKITTNEKEINYVIFKLRLDQKFKAIKKIAISFIRTYIWRTNK
jgi:hypothetical protein